jgi:hypothetical protein
MEKKKDTKKLHNNELHNNKLPNTGVRGGRAVHGASDVSDSQACNQSLCGVWVRSQLAAQDILHRIKGIFGAGHVPVVSSGYSGFLHHQKGPIPPMSWVGATHSVQGSPRGE